MNTDEIAEKFKEVTGAQFDLHETLPRFGIIVDIMPEVIEFQQWKRVQQSYDLACRVTETAALKAARGITDLREIGSLSARLSAWEGREKAVIWKQTIGTEPGGFLVRFVVGIGEREPVPSP